MCRCALYATQLSTAAADDDTTNVLWMVEFETETHVVARTNSALCSHKHTQSQVHFWSAHGFSPYTSIKWISSSSVVAVSRQVLPSVDWLRSLPAYRRNAEPGMMRIRSKRTNEKENFSIWFCSKCAVVPFNRKHQILQLMLPIWLSISHAYTHNIQHHPIDSLCACQSICICLEPNILYQFL